MNNTAENDFFGFPKVQWLRLTGEVDNLYDFRVKIFSGFHVPKSLKSVNFWQSYLKNKRWTFLGHCVYAVFK